MRRLLICSGTPALTADVSKSKQMLRLELISNRPRRFLLLPTNGRKRLPTKR